MKKDIRQLSVIVVILCAVVVLAFVLAAPGTAGTNSSEGVRTITDMDGRTVTIPSEIRTVVITCCGGAAQELAALGVSDLVVAQPKQCVTEWLYRVAPGYRNVPDVGIFENANVEEIMKIDPDIVIGRYSSSTHIEATGIPVVGVLTGIAETETLKREFLMMGAVFGREERAERLVDYWDEVLARIESKVADIPKDERKRVYGGSGAWEEAMINAAGGINVAASHTQQSGSEVSPEQIVRWNPEVIYYSPKSGDTFSTNPQFETIQAVQDGAVYPCPAGTMFSWSRPSPEAPLANLWLAQKLYPDRFADLDLADETKMFFREFYDYDLTDEEVESILHPIPTSTGM